MPSITAKKNNSVRSLYKYLGWMDAQEAFSHGFTHHGRYCGMPVWLGEPFGHLQITAKWAPLELAVVILWMAHSLRPSIFHRSKAEFGHLLQLGAPITPVSPFL